MELNFIKCGDYYIPDIKLRNPNIRLGKWGRMRKEYGRYLRKAKSILREQSSKRAFPSPFAVCMLQFLSSLFALKSEEKTNDI